jgi:hypothetical protein
VHFMRNVLARVPKGNAELVAAAIRTIFAQPDAEHVHAQFDMIAGMLGRQFPAVEAMLREADADLLAFTGFPVSHWKKIWSTNPLERLNKEIKRRTDVVGVSPNPASLLRLAGAVLVEAHDEWQVSDRRYLPKDRWPSSPTALTRPRRWRSRHWSRHSHPTADQHGEDYIHHSAGRHHVARGRRSALWVRLRHPAPPPKVRATVRVAGQDVSCVQGQTLTVGTLTLTCTSVTSDTVRIDVSPE